MDDYGPVDCFGDGDGINGDAAVDADINSGGAAVSPETVRYFLSLDMKVSFWKKFDG